MSLTAKHRGLRPVSNPIAFDAAGRLVDVEDAEREGRYTCVHCSRRVVPSRGERLQWHYRHVEVSSCAPRSDLLLDTALKAIRAAFQYALSARQSYLMSLPCLYCPARFEQDLVALFDRAEIAATTAVGKRDRLVFSPRKREAANLEVVVLVGNDKAPTPGDDACPTVVLSTDWDEVTSLSKCLVATKYIAAKPLLCRLCQTVESPKKRDYVLVPIVEDRYSAPLFPEMSELVNGAAAKLAEIGFQQSGEKPYLLYRRFGGYVSGVVFADYGGLRGERIWQARGGRLYGQFSDGDNGAGEALLSRVAAICERRGIPLSYPNSHGGEE